MAQSQCLSSPSNRSASMHAHWQHEDLRDVRTMDSRRARSLARWAAEKQLEAVGIDLEELCASEARRRQRMAISRNLGDASLKGVPTEAALYSAVMRPEANEPFSAPAVVEATAAAAAAA